jgi:hypothetical protein
MARRQTATSRAARGTSEGMSQESVDFRDAVARLASDSRLAEKFIADPESVLEIMGVDTSNLVVQRTVGVGDPSRLLEAARRPEVIDEEIGLTICASVGFIVCASVGGEVSGGPVEAARKFGEALKKAQQ